VTELSSGNKRILLRAGVLVAAVAIPLGIHQGGDFTAELRQSERLLHGLPLYPANPPIGIWWPPFTALGLVPFALLARWSLVLSKACWATGNVVCLGWSVARARRWTTSWTPVVLALGAVGTPLQSNFAYLNLTPILLALVVAAALNLEGGRDARAGAWIGLATAIKVFPALLLLYLAYRRRWRGLATGIGVAGGLTVGAMLSYGPVGAVRAVRDWVWLSSQAHVFAQTGNQSLAGLASFFGWPPAAVWVARVACLGGVWIALQRLGGERDPVYEISLVTLLAVLLSPLAWPYYYILAFPAWVGVLTRPTPHTPQGRRLKVATVMVAGLLTSGALTLSLYPPFLGFIRNAGYTWGGLLLLTLLIAARGFRPQSEAARLAVLPEQDPS
jgi:alpha-1,2-mannosyltransferase